MKIRRPMAAPGRPVGARRKDICSHSSTGCTQKDYGVASESQMIASVPVFWDAPPTSFN